MSGRLNPIQQAIQRLGSDWIGEQVVRLGDYTETVETGVPGQYWARQHNGQVIKVRNTVLAPPIFDLRVLARRSRIQPNVWKIAEVFEDYEDPVAGGRIASHHEQHEEEGFDRVKLDRKQISQLSVRAAGGWTVNVYGATVSTASGLVFVDNEEALDLSAHVVTTGARWTAIEIDDSGDLSPNDGTSFSAPNLGTAANLPAPDPGKYPIAYILFYEGQTSIIDANIRAIMPLPGSAFSGSHTHEIFDDTEGDPEDVSQTAAADGTSDFASRRDHIHLVTLFDDTEGDPAPVSTSAAADGTSDFASRRDHVHLYTPETSGGGGHEHGLARWNGASGQSTFDLPDFAARIDGLMINGLEEDPLVYSLSSDGSQIVLDSALSSDSNVIAHYVLLSM